MVMKIHIKTCRMQLKYYLQGNITLNTNIKKEEMKIELSKYLSLEVTNARINLNQSEESNSERN